MKIVFFGTPEFAIPALESLISSEYDLLAVVTNPDKKLGRGLKLSSSPISSFCQKKAIKYKHYFDFNSSETYNELKSFNADLFVVVAFQILPEKIINIPRFGSINIHPSLLPKYRGASPIQYAILNGDKETGISIFQLSRKVDAGNIIIQEPFPISNEDTFSLLYDNLSRKGAQLLMKAIKLIKSKEVKYVPQNNIIESSAPNKTTYARKITAKDCLIDWSMPADKINNRIRAFSKRPGAFTFLNGKKIKIFNSKIYKEHPKGIEKSLGVSYKGLFLIGTKDWPIQVNSLQLEGKKIIRGKDFINSNFFVNSKILNFE